MGGFVEKSSFTLFTRFFFYFSLKAIIRLAVEIYRGKKHE